MPERSYLDWNATAPVRPEAAEAMARALLLPGNPSSVHAEGRAARAAVEAAREQVGRLVGAPVANVTFTSGGSEANSAALSPGLSLGDGRACEHLIICATEHACVREGHRFAPEAVRVLPVNGEGVVDLAHLAVLLAAPRVGRALVSVHLANNETGVVQPIAAIALMCRQQDALLHVDAVQAAGKIAIDMTTLGADVLTLSAHKLAGPKGVGALITGSAAVSLGAPLFRGGGQERGMRAGTENVPGIVGFGAAAAAALAELDSEARRQSALRDRMERDLRALATDLVVFGADAPRLPNTSCFAAPQTKAETALILIDLAGVSVSSGSACSSGKVRASHVLAAMGVAPELAAGALRVSFGRTTRDVDVERFLGAYRQVLARRPASLAQAAA